LLAALEYYNEERRPEFREGVKHFKDKKTDIFLITLNKSEKDFSPSTLYEDYEINEKLFHWQSQNKLTITSTSAQKQIHIKKNKNIYIIKKTTIKLLYSLESINRSMVILHHIPF